MPLLLSSSPITILPASWPFISWRCLLLAFLPGSWISALSAFTPLLIALGHSHFAQARPFADIALSAGAFPFCSGAAIC